MLKQSFKAKSDIEWDGHSGHTCNYKADIRPVSFGQRAYAWPVRCWAHLESALFLDCQLSAKLTGSCLQGLLHCGLRESTLPLDGIQQKRHKVIFPLWALTHFLPVGEGRSRFPQLWFPDTKLAPKESWQARELGYEEIPWGREGINAFCRQLELT